MDPCAVRKPHVSSTEVYGAHGRATQVNKVTTKKHSYLRRAADSKPQHVQTNVASVCCRRVLRFTSREEWPLLTSTLAHGLA
jgi:hypothetical protein